MVRVSPSGNRWQQANGGKAPIGGVRFLACPLHPYSKQRLIRLLLMIHL